MKENYNEDNFTTFKKAVSDMIAKNGKSWNESLGY